ncbi:MAG: hypothetical protein ACIAQF_09005 [Phycisphaerales bacterium JB065]
MARFRRRAHPLALTATLGAGLACACGLGGCSSHPTQRASLEHRTLVIEPVSITASAAPASFGVEHRSVTLSGVPTD